MGVLLHILNCPPDSFVSSIVYISGSEPISSI